jgi:16S rRNA (guanine527-N7)-methyltransferase
MVDSQIIYKYFPDLADTQKQQIERLYALYLEWNIQINVISRKDIDELYLRHVLHSLAIARFVDFAQIRSVLDIGTGGGFPGIPLAILFPEVQFHLVDSIGKKIKVVNEVAAALGIRNVKAEQLRAEQVSGKYDLIVSRAVTQLVDFYPWITKNLKPDTEVAFLKGGDLTQEIINFKSVYPRKKVIVEFIYPSFDDAFFETKKVLIVR